MVYKIVIEDGSMIGKYSDKKTPGEVAKSAMKVIYNKTKRQEANIKIYNTKTKKYYTYKSSIRMLDTPIYKKIGDNEFMIKYKVENIRI